MSWWRRVFGLDGFDIALQTVITAIILVWIAAVNDHGEDVVIFSSIAMVTSLVILAVRRRLALNRVERLGSNDEDAARLAELEQRVAELEFAQARLLELEERLDFTERLLARAPEQRVLPGGESP